MAALMPDRSIGAIHQEEKSSNGNIFRVVMPSRIEIKRNDEGRY
jgi:hypothetical protein